jgi:hypothetical protein
MKHGKKGSLDFDSYVLLRHNQIIPSLRQGAGSLLTLLKYSTIPKLVLKAKGTGAFQFRGKFQAEVGR